MAHKYLLAHFPGENKLWLEMSRGLMAKVLDCDLQVSEFEFQSRYYIYFQTNNLREGMNPLIATPVMS